MGARSVSIISVKVAPANGETARRGGACAGGGSGGRRWRLGPHPAGGEDRSILARLGRVQVVHGDDHGHGLLLGDQIVQDQVRAALRVPALFILAPAMHEVEHGVAFLGGVVVWRGIDVAAAPLRSDGGVVPALAHLPVRDVLVRVVVHFGSFRNSMPLLSQPLPRRCGRWGRPRWRRPRRRCSSEVEAHNQRRGGDAPHTIAALDHVEVLAHAELDLSARPVRSGGTRPWPSGYTQGCLAPGMFRELGLHYRPPGRSTARQRAVAIGNPTISPYLISSS